MTLQENRAEAAIAGEKAARTPRFVTVKNGTHALDEASLARARRLVGLDHHTRDATEAHLTVVFAALAVARYLQAATGLSIMKIVRALKPLQQSTLHIAGHDHTAADP